MRKALFTMDCLEGNYEGVTHGDTWTWNGWACPTFHIDVVRAIIEDMDSCSQALGFEPTRYELNGNEIKVWVDSYEEWEVYAIDKNGMCAFGSHSWCWYEAYKCKDCGEIFYNACEVFLNGGEAICDECETSLNEQKKREDTLDSLGQSVKELIAQGDITISIYDAKSGDYYDGKNIIYKVDEEDGEMVLDFLIDINEEV